GDDAHARRPEPVERRQGSVVGAVAHRAGVRGEVRPHAGSALPARCGVPAVATRQEADRLPLRSARGDDAVRARESIRGDERGMTGGYRARRPLSGELAFALQRSRVDVDDPVNRLAELRQIEGLRYHLVALTAHALTSQRVKACAVSATITQLRVRR